MNLMSITPPTGGRHADILAALTGLFALRVAGQAVQRWAPVSFLPPFGQFQGSDLPYWFLLSAQLVLLALMAAVTRQVATGAKAPQPRIGHVLAWVGGFYMAGSLARIAVGLTLTGAHAWFSAWISSAFHLVLAGFILTLASYHRAPALSNKNLIIR